MKKLLGVFLAAILILSMSVPAIAAGETVTISPGEDFEAGVWYEATLSNVVSEGQTDAEEVHEKILNAFQDSDFFIEELYIDGDVTVYNCDAPATLEFFSGLMGVYWVGNQDNITNNTYLEADEFGLETVYGDLSFNAPGTYIVIFQDFAGEILVFCVEIGGNSEQSENTEEPKEPEEPAPAGKIVNPTASTVYINDAEEAFEAYTIDGSNYFKLRDLAQSLNDTSKQFEVEWDGENNAIILTGGEPYTSVGGEMAQGDGTPKTANPTSSKIYLDGKELTLTVYTINGNNFFKLRDLMSALDVYVGYDNETKNITVDTSRGYEAE